MVEYILSPWFKVIDEDLKVAKRCAEDETWYTGSYHVEQAAEKLVKMALAARGRTIRKTHNIGSLVDMLDVDDPLRDDFKNLEFLTTYATAGRYPDELDICLDGAEILEWVEKLIILRDNLRQMFPEADVPSFDED